MHPLKSEEIYGNWATLLLPIEDDDSINFSKLERDIDTLIAMRVNGIYSNGTAGEFYNQTEEEFDKISFLLAEKCNRVGMPFQIGCNHMSPKISLERVRRIVPLHPGAIQVILPDWVPPTRSEIMHYLQVMAEAAYPVSLVLYNPPHAKKLLTPEELSQIKQEVHTLVGCKVGWKDESRIRTMREMAPDVSLFVPGHYLATGIQSGAQGSYSNVACLHPLAAQQWYDLIQEDLETALELETKIQLFMRDHILTYIKEREYSNQAVDKLLAAIGGWSEVDTRLRWPYKWIPQEEVDKMRKICQTLLPEFFLNQPTFH